MIHREKDTPKDIEEILEQEKSNLKKTMFTEKKNITYLKLQ